MRSNSFSKDILLGMRSNSLPKDILLVEIQPNNLRLETERGGNSTSSYT